MLNRKDDLRDGGPVGDSAIPKVRLNENCKAASDAGRGVGTAGAKAGPIIGHPKARTLVVQLAE